MTHIRRVLTPGSTAAYNPHGLEVIVSTFPPVRDGISRYAEQQVSYLRKGGSSVFTIGLPGSAGDVVLPSSPWMALRVMRECRNRGRAMVHWQDVYYFLGGARGRILTSLSWMLLFWRCPQVEVLCHEAGLEPAPKGAIRRFFHRIDTALRRRMWLTAPKVILHSPAEREKLEARLGVTLDDSRVSYLPHGTFLEKTRDLSREEARRELGLPLDKKVFLCIGFLGGHKGFHRAIHSFVTVPPEHGVLYVVGSLLTRTPHALQYAEKLRELANARPNTTFLEQYVSDEDFDVWIAASDYVLTPYGNAFSSSVAERAKLYERPLIASAVGGLPHQLTDRDHVFASDEELAILLRQLSLEPSSSSNREHAGATPGVGR